MLVTFQGALIIYYTHPCQILEPKLPTMQLDDQQRLVQRLQCVVQVAANVNGSHSITVGPGSVKHCVLYLSNKQSVL